LEDTFPWSGCGSARVGGHLRARAFFRRSPGDDLDRSRDTVEDLARLGREVERRVLARAVRWHLEDRILVDGNRTVVFE